MISDGYFVLCYLARGENDHNSDFNITEIGTNLHTKAEVLFDRAPVYSNTGSNSSTSSRQPESLKQCDQTFKEYKCWNEGLLATWDNILCRNTSEPKKCYKIIK